MKRVLKGLKATLPIAVILFLNGCSSINLPELSTPEITLPDFGLTSKAKPALPISVSYAFDATVTQATLQVEACGLPHTIDTGEIVPQAFLAIGQEQFNSVTAYSGSGQAVQTSQQTDLTVYLQLIHQSFIPGSNMAQEDTFVATINLQMLATFIDPSGNQLAQRPLNYSAQASLWAPALTSQSTSCLTAAYDDEISRAAGDLANQMVSMVPQLSQPAAEEPITAQTTPSVQNQIQQQPLPVMKFRTMLRDGNNNLILEGGEVIILQIEATNSGNQPLSTVTIELKGNQTLLQAFSDMTTLPISFGDFQPGETKTTEVRGQMPLQISENKGELLVTVKPRNGSIVGSHRILAVLQAPSRTGRQSSSTPLSSQSQQQKTAPSENKYVAILIGMDQYRDNGLKAYRVQKGQIKALKDTLQTTGLFSKTNTRILQGSHATRNDIEETLLSWGRQRLGRDSILIFHFSGQALSHPTTGEVYLMPFEGSPKTSIKQLIALRTLQRVLGQLENRLTLLVLDTPVRPLFRQSRSTSTNGSIPIKWASGLSLSKERSTRVIQIRKNSPQKNDGPAKLLAGLLGQADRNGNGTVTLEEFLRDVNSISEITSTPVKNSFDSSLPLTQ